MDGLKRVVYSARIPPGLISALSTLLQMLNKLYPGLWAFKVSWQVRAGGQIVITAELKLGRATR